MKKIIVTIGILTTLAVASSYAQGTVVFGNATTTKISTNAGPNGVTGVGLVTANANQTFYYALFYSTSQTTVSGSSAAVIGLNGGTYAFNASGWTDGNANGYSTNSGAGRLQLVVGFLVVNDVRSQTRFAMLFASILEVNDSDIKLSGLGSSSFTVSR
jgi:hypothetical protein